MTSIGMPMLVLLDAVWMVGPTNNRIKAVATDIQ
jgi:hypothetical protein